MQFPTVQKLKWNKFFTAAVFAFALSAILAAPVFAQGESSIEGTVTDSSGGGIPGVSVQIKDLETGAERLLTTDDSGRFSAAALSVGQYEVRAEKSGFRAEVKNGISLVVGQRLFVDLVLQIGDVRQVVEVPSVSTVVAVTTDDSSGLVGERQVKELPLNGRSYDQLITLNPGVVNYTSQRAGGIGTSNSVVGNMFAASGRRPQENLYLLNGVEFTSASEINNTPGGVSGQLLGVDSVREFSVVKDTYGASTASVPARRSTSSPAPVRILSTAMPTNFSVTARLTPATSSTTAAFRNFNAMNSAARSVARLKKTRLFSSEITKASAKISALAISRSFLTAHPAPVPSPASSRFSPYGPSPMARNF